ncbi:bifunctional diguanylate cyclase/phosphodiesterase [Erythrobacter sp. HKB08]|uniref:putative bifunctional diguanylate cyclase/phosphodiesterase n=1 Tax=Erythrobacter sp. HKB08 TaxID=2502843 RepID=UPI0010092138|nr:GGDEF and EAL domain-containing protein [Erythrobacter sp. HKB08]
MAKAGFLSKLSRNSGERAAAYHRVPISADDLDRRVALLDNFEGLNLGWFWATNDEGRLIYLSESAAKLVGRPLDEVIGLSLTELFVPDKDDDPDKAERPLPFLLSARNSFADLPARVSLSSDDRELWWSISGKPQYDEEGNFIGYRGAAKDITAVRERERDAKRLAQFDGLTGLANRNRMEKRLTATLTAYKAAKRSCALLMLDLDRFKQVNDTLGHPAGDELLKQVATRLEKIIGDDGEIGRLGGDEFQVILPDIDDRGKLGDISHRLIQMISQPYSINGSRAIIGTSVGIAIAPYDGIEAEELVSSADLALYAAKGGGRGQFRFYSSELKEGARERKEISDDLRDAIAHEQLELHYQPLIDPETNKVRSLEALMRWNHPEKGRISPATFIPIAEESAIINDVGKFALEQACKDAAQWPGDISVAVNVSAVQFANDKFPDVVEQALAKSGLAPSRLTLEITESVFVADPHATNRMFQRLKKRGVSLALDDFGTGYSSLSYLTRAPFDKIKIDQSFVRGATEDDNNNAAIISAIVGLARALGMTTVAEGVEARDELELVTERGADLIQGFVFSKAIRQQELLERFENGQLEFEIVGPSKHRAERKRLFRRIGVIHEDHRYEAVLRNLSRTGAMIEGLLNVPQGTALVLDLGEGQLAVAKVRRTMDARQGLEFEQPLVSDGTDGLCTRHRVSPYALAAAGMPLASLPPGDYPLIGGEYGEKPKTQPQFMEVKVSQSN